MYYNRTISQELSKLLEVGGELRWLFDFVKKHEQLDFLLVKNNSKESISIYRGLTSIFSIKIKDNTTVLITADDKYKKILPDLYGSKKKDVNFKNEIELLIKRIEEKSEFDRYYKNKKEGYYQNELSKIYGICGKPDADFVIIDKEVVIGYNSEAEKKEHLGNIQEKYKRLQRLIFADNPKRYGKNVEKKSIGNELDFLALDKEGNILLIEYKHGTNTSGIYLCPLQIGMYNDIFISFQKSKKRELEKSVFEMLEQKQKIGLINPNFKSPNHIKKIIPVLIISEFNYKSSAKTKFDEVLHFTRSQNSFGSEFLDNLQTFNFTEKSGLSKW